MRPCAHTLADPHDRKPILYTAECLHRTIPHRIPGPVVLQILSESHPKIHSVSVYISSKTDIYINIFILFWYFWWQFQLLLHVYMCLCFSVSNSVCVFCTWIYACVAKKQKVQHVCFYAAFAAFFFFFSSEMSWYVWMNGYMFFWILYYPGLPWLSSVSYNFFSFDDKD